MFAKGDGSPVAIGRNVSDGDERHDDPIEKSYMISGQFGTCRCPLWLSLSTRQSGRAKLSGTETSGEGNRRAAWGDRTRGHPVLVSSRDWPGTPYDAGRTRLGPSQYIGSQQSRDSSTTVRSALLLIPNILRRRRTKGAIRCGRRSCRFTSIRDVAKRLKCADCVEEPARPTRAHSGRDGHRARL